eukprot:1534208-Alexandrium_andersonii.AAC.1
MVVAPWAKMLSHGKCRGRCEAAPHVALPWLSRPWCGTHGEARHPLGGGSEGAEPRWSGTTLAHGV